MSETIDRYITLKQAIKYNLWYLSINTLGGAVRVDTTKQLGASSIVCAQHHRDLIFELSSLGTGNGIRKCPVRNCPTRISEP